MKKQYVYFLKGLPASGKSTWAKQKIDEDRQKGIITKRINKDDLRAMLDNSVWSKERESFVLKIRDAILTMALANGYNVIIDDTNFAESHKIRIMDLVNDLRTPKVSIDFIEKFFDTPLHECIERDSKREKPVGRKVIMDMYNRYLKETKEATIEYDQSLPDCIICDVDGTLALHENRKPYDYWSAGSDRLNKPVASLVKRIQEYYNFGIPLFTIIVTARENVCREEDGDTILDVTQQWLRYHCIHFDDVLIRKDKDHRPDYIVKKEMYEEHIKGKYNVLYVIDDRKQVIDMWRSLGLTVLDVAGNEF